MSERNIYLTYYSRVRIVAQLHFGPVEFAQAISGEIKHPTGHTYD